MLAGRLTESGPSTERVFVVEWKTTSTILRGLRDFDDEEAWQRLVVRFRRPIISFARKAGLSPSDVEDVAQETLIAFAQGYRNGDYDPKRGRLSRWLFGIAYKHILRQRQRDGRRREKVAAGFHGTTFWGAVEDEEAATGTWDQEWNRSLWQECVELVRPEFEQDTFRAFALVVRDECKPAEAARKLGVPIKFVYNAKHRVLKRLRELRADLENVE